MQGVLDAVADLHGQSLLYLEAAGIALDDAGYLAEPYSSMSLTTTI